MQKHAYARRTNNDKNEKNQHLVDFFLVPNYEFKTQVLKIGEDAVVISPIDFREEIKRILKATLRGYI